jgi:hypothetical protein
MFNFKNIILIFIILFLLNQVNINSKIIKNDVKKYSKQKHNIKTIIKKTPQQKKLMPVIEDKDLLFGKDQYIVNSININQDLKYQDLPILKSNNNFELTSNLKFNYDMNNIVQINNLNKNKFDNRILVDKINNIKINKPLNKDQIIDNYQKENKKGFITTPLNNIDYATPKSMQEETINQKMLYDFRFLDMNKNDLETIIKNEDNSLLEGKTIKEVYDNLILDFKKINQKNTPIINTNSKINGAFGESTLAIEHWYYDEDNNNDFGFDESQILELAVEQKYDPNDIY